MSEPFLTPRQIVAELDQYIIGQDQAKRSVAIALRNRWRRQQVAENLREEIMPNNIILIGPTGVGKTEIARRLARLTQAPFIKVEATKFTEVGYVGKDVESMVRDLVELAVTQVRSRHMEEVREKARIMALEQVLDILIPSVQRNRQESWFSAEQSTPAVTDSDVELNEKTREKFREKLKAGSLADREIEISVQPEQMPFMQVVGASGLDDLNKQIQDVFDSLGQKKQKKRKLKVKEALEVLEAEEAGKLIDMDAIRKEAVRLTENHGIIFIDEIDKIAVTSSQSGGPDVSRSGVQRDLLPIVEGTSVSTKYGVVKTDHILFIASGAFHMSKPSDLIPELQGRFPIRVELKSLTEKDFISILTQPANALTRQYQALLQTEGVDLTFTEDGIAEIARIATEVNQEVENIGARRLHTILSTLFEEIMFMVPDQITEPSIRVDRNLVDQRLSGLVKNRDLSRYIL